MPPRTKSEQVVWGVLLAGMALLITVALFNFLRPSPVPLARLAPSPSFILTEQTGNSFSSNALTGKVWMASFIFTRCRGICPLIITSQKYLYDRLDPAKPWTMVSFTVDPENDTPEVLAVYAQKLGSDSKRWSFLTGEKQQLHELIIKGFLLAVADENGTDEEPILHSQRIVLIDAEGTIRGYYDSQDPMEMDRLLDDANRLLGEIS